MQLLNKLIFLITFMLLMQVQAQPSTESATAAAFHDDSHLLSSTLLSRFEDLLSQFFTFKATDMPYRGKIDVFYHITSLKNRDSIMRDGLLASYGGRSEWGFSRKSEEFKTHSTGKVHLSTDYQKLCDTYRMLIPDEVVVFAVYYYADDFIVDEDDATHAISTRHNIPPRSIVATDLTCEEKDLNKAAAKYSLEAIDKRASKPSRTEEAAAKYSDDLCPYRQ